MVLFVRDSCSLSWPLLMKTDTHMHTHTNTHIYVRRHFHFLANRCKLCLNNCKLINHFQQKQKFSDLTSTIYCIQYLKVPQQNRLTCWQILSKLEYVSKHLSVFVVASIIDRIHLLLKILVHSKLAFLVLGKISSILIFDRKCKILLKQMFLCYLATTSQLSRVSCLVLCLVSRQCQHGAVNKSLN